MKNYFLLFAWVPVILMFKATSADLIFFTLFLIWLAFDVLGGLADEAEEIAELHIGNLYATDIAAEFRKSGNLRDAVDRASSSLGLFLERGAV